MMFNIFFSSIILFFFTLVPILISVAYIILAERKVMASIQRRKGPNVVGFFGLLQPFIDAVKLLSKEHIFPLKLNLWIFCFAPIWTLIVAIINWSFIPFNISNFYYDFTYSVFFVLTFSSVGIYGIVLSGWASNSKYALLGTVRTIAQFISYELILTLTIFPIILITHSLNFIEIVNWQIHTSWFIFSLWPFAYIFFIASLAETNRTPFDLPEAEAELVAGYNVEYSSVFFILFMFAEYSNILFMSTLFSILFLGGWDGYFTFLNILNVGEVILAFKITFIAFVFIVIRATQPRVRFDQLLNLCWKRFLPLVFSLLLLALPLYICITFFCIKSFLVIFVSFFDDIIIFFLFIFLLARQLLKLENRYLVSYLSIFILLIFLSIITDLVIYFIFSNFTITSYCLLLCVITIFIEIGITYSICISSFYFNTIASPLLMILVFFLITGLDIVCWHLLILIK